jgi:hypothetical protein
MTDAFAAIREEIEAMRTCTAQAAEGYENDDRDAGPLWGRVDALDALLGLMNTDPRFTGVSSAAARPDQRLRQRAEPEMACMESCASRSVPRGERPWLTTLIP